MKRVIQLLGFILLFCAFHSAHAGTCPIAAGASQSTIASTITGCTTGNSVTFAAGTYTMTASVAVPCGVTLTGPTVAGAVYTAGDGYKRWGYTPTAIINASVTPVFTYGTCATARSFTYIEVANNRPSTGGQAIYISSAGGVSNLTIFGNYFHGNNWNGTGTYGSGPQNASLVLFDGTSSTTADVNDTVTWNRFGANGDCASVINNKSYSGFSGDGGYCNGLGFHTNLTNFNANNNFVYYQEQGFKGYEGSWACLSCTIQANDYSNIHRIGIETQILGTGTSILYAYNSMHDQVTPSNGTFGLSSANGCGNTNPSTSHCTTQDLGNVIANNVATTGSFNGLGIEFWSANTASYAKYNLVQGQWSNSIDIATDGAATFTGNLVESSYGAGGSNSPANCYPGYAGSFGWWAVEDSPVNTPTNGGSNTCHFYDGSVQTSVAPSISPNGGNFSGSQTVTLVNNGTLRDTNTSIWYTTDGCNPVPASVDSCGTNQTQPYTGPFTITGTTTIKAVGMWGALNQPTTWPTGPELAGSGATGYGYKPSTAVSATFTAGGTPVQAATPAISPASTTFVGSQIVTISDITPSSTIYYTLNGAIPTTSSTVYTGPFSINATTTVQAIATAPGYSTSSVGSATYTLSNTPTLQSVTIALTGGGTTIPLSGTVQAIASCTFSDGSVITSPNTGCIPSSWNSNATPIASANSTGVYTGNSAGPANIWAVVGGITGQSLSITVTAASLTSIAITGSNNVNIGAIDNLGALCTFSDGSSSVCTANITAWTSSATTIATVSSAGAVTGLAAGYTNIVASYNGVSSPNFQVQVVSQAGSTQITGLQIQGYVVR